MADYVYDLTPLTRQAKESRRIVLLTVDLSREAWMTIGIGAAAGFAIMLPLMPLIGVLCIIAPFITTAIAYFLIQERSSQGMHLKNWKTLLDKQRSRNGVVFVCGHEVDVTSSEVRYLYTLTAPNTTRGVVTDDDIYAGSSPR